MKFSIQVEADDPEGLDKLVAATEKWLKVLGVIDATATADFALSVERKP